MTELLVGDPIVLDDMVVAEPVTLHELYVTEPIDLPIENIVGGAVLTGNGPPSLTPGDPTYTEGAEIGDNYVNLVTGDYYKLEEISMTATWVQVGNIQGPPGIDAFYYEHNQDTPSAGWYVNHDLGKRPNVEVLIGDEVVEADVSHIDQNNIYIVFASPQTGKVILT